MINLNGWQAGHVPVSAGGEQQLPLLDGHAWITAHARVDARNELRRELATAGRPASDTATDGELILHACDAWGNGCLDHVHGDFAFAIRDAPRRLFCARDHFGVRPFYYAGVGDAIVFGSTLQSVRQHRAVSGRLNEQALADFLSFGFKQDHGATAFADVHSLPPAHSLVFEGGRVSIQRYWTLPVEPVRFRRPEECRERYLELLEAAVADRLRGVDRAAILLSGGIDSPSIAAIAARLKPCPTGGRGDPPPLKAYTVVYDRLIDHDERKWAGAVAEHLGIPIEFVPADDVGLYEGWDGDGNPKGLPYGGPGSGNPKELPYGGPYTTPEPIDNPFWALPVRLFKKIADDGYNVVLTGEAGDALSVPERALPELLGTGHLAALARDVYDYWCSHGQRPPFWIRPWLKRTVGSWQWAVGSRSRVSRRASPAGPGVPSWLNPQVAADVLERARERAPIPGGGWAHQELQSPMWPWCALTQSPEWTGVPVDVRYPFLDLRLVSFMLSVPSVPWMHDKELMRTAMRGRLPDEVLRRPKVPLRQDPIDALCRRDGPPPLPDRKSPVWEFVDRAAFEEEWSRSTRFRELLRVVSLDKWLRQTGKSVRD